MSGTRTEGVLNDLSCYGDLPDDGFPLGQAALRLAALGRPGISLDRYDTHLAKIAEDTGIRYSELLAAGATDEAETRLAALKHTLVDKYGYEFVAEVGLEKDNLIDTIDNRAGPAAMLNILYVTTAQAQGWQAGTLDIPGHFVARLDHDGKRLIFDPASNCRILQAADLRIFVKEVLGPEAELSADYYRPVSNREMLVNIQNSFKLKLIEQEDYPAALTIVEALRRLAPLEYRLLLDAGILYARVDRLDEAIAALEKYITEAPGPGDRHDAALLLEQIRSVVLPSSDTP